jgi:hypothetical protein
MQRIRFKDGDSVILDNVYHTDLAQEFVTEGTNTKATRKEPFVYGHISLSIGKEYFTYYPVKDILAIEDLQSQ